MRARLGTNAAITGFLCYAVLQAMRTCSIREQAADLRPNESLYEAVGSDQQKEKLQCFFVLWMSVSNVGYLIMTCVCGYFRR